MTYRPYEAAIAGTPHGKKKSSESSVVVSMAFPLTWVDCKAPLRLRVRAKGRSVCLGLRPNVQLCPEQPNLCLWDTHRSRSQTSLDFIVIETLSGKYVV